MAEEIFYLGHPPSAIRSLRVEKVYGPDIVEERLADASGPGIHYRAFYDGRILSAHVVSTKEIPASGLPTLTLQMSASGRLEAVAADGAEVLRIDTHGQHVHAMTFRSGEKLTFDRLPRHRMHTALASRNGKVLHETNSEITYGRGAPWRVSPDLVARDLGLPADWFNVIRKRRSSTATVQTIFAGGRTAMYIYTVDSGIVQTARPTTGTMKNRMRRPDPIPWSMSSSLRSRPACKPDRPCRRCTVRRSSRQRARATERMRLAPLMR